MRAKKERESHSRQKNSPIQKVSALSDRTAQKRYGVCCICCEYESISSFIDKDRPSRCFPVSQSRSAKRRAVSSQSPPVSVLIIIPSKKASSMPLDNPSPKNNALRCFYEAGWLSSIGAITCYRTIWMPLPPKNNALRCFYEAGWLSSIGAITCYRTIWTPLPPKNNALRCFCEAGWLSSIGAITCYRTIWTPLPPKNNALRCFCEAGWLSSIGAITYYRLLL